MPEARINTEHARKALQDFRFADLFIEQLGWNNPTSRVSIPLQDAEGNKWTANEISQLSGFRVFEVVPDDVALSRPDAKNQQILWKSLTAQAVENIAIFVDPKRTQSLWLWMKRDGKRVLPRKHAYIKGQPGDLFLAKLSALVVDLSELDEEGNLPITETANRVRAALDVEVVTKVFFKRFQEIHGAFLKEINGIPDERDRRWYASVILNRLMFIWFLQKKGFIDRADRPDGNRNYLRDKLAALPKGKNQFYSHFLRDLFFEGFAKPENKRKLIGTIPLGDIPYLNGGLFLPHGIEQRIEGNVLVTEPFSRIKISDSAFDDVFRLFADFSWSLNDVPGGDDREINPAVLGYIFEKYINQKEFGAYYTRPEITEYLCEQTIHQHVIDAANKHAAGQQLLVRHGLKKTALTAQFESVGDILLRADGSLCGELLHTVLPQLSILDPAVGSGAFLVAALKTLLAIYTGLLGRAEAVQHKAVLQWVEAEKKKHKAPIAYWLKKKIITENLFGVDIIEEGVEIAKLRLFLALVASAEKREHLEPLPNIEFNLMSGNSLIGLLHVDPKKFDSSIPSGAQGRMTLRHEPTAKDLGFAVESKTAPTAKEKVGAHLAEKRAKKYDELLREKNRLVDLYKRSALDFEDLTTLKQSIESKKDEARAILNKLLLDEFVGFGIRFEQATWDNEERTEGKSEKRQLTIEDIQKLRPFHWAYEFDEILVDLGGFDIIIANPPWDVFQTHDKEFLQNYAPTIQKKALRIEDWEEEKAELLEDKSIRADWLEYCSRFPHQWQYFKRAPSFSNQTATLNGKAVGNKPNLYGLFLEQSKHLLHESGRCGILVPSGLYTDLGSKQLRVMLFEQCEVTGLFGFENRKKIFEGVDSRFKFAVLSFQKGSSTQTFPAVFMRLDVSELDTFPATDSLRISVSLIKKLSPSSFSIMEFKDQIDVTIAEKLIEFPLLYNDAGWQLELYGEELNMTRSAGYFLTKRTSFPLYEGDMIWQFDHRYSVPRYWVDEPKLRSVFQSKRVKRIVGMSKQSKDLRNDYTVQRLAIRKIASNTNERTLIATLIPPYSLTGHSLSVHFPFHHQLENYNELRFSDAELLCLCGLLNSFVVDYALRSRMTTNLSSFFLYQLPVPRLTSTDRFFRPIVERAARLIGTSREFDDLLKGVFGPKANHKSHGVADETKRGKLRAEIDATVAQVYGLSEPEFTHILSTFPLVPQEVKTLALNTFIATLPSADDKAVRQLIERLENDKVEFKEAAAFSSQRNQKSPDMMRNVLREVAAFLNSGGGNVILGVTDKGKVIGIADDLQYADPKKKNRDGYELFLRNSISGKLGAAQSSSCKISFHKIDGLEVCRIFVPGSATPVYLDDNLIIRDGTSSRQLNAQETAAYVAQHWPSVT